MRIAGAMGWSGCVVMLTLAAMVARAVHAETGVGAIEAAPASGGEETARIAAPPRLAPPVLLSVEIVPDDKVAAERSAIRDDGVRCGPGMPVACDGMSAGAGSAQRAH